MGHQAVQHYDTHHSEVVAYDRQKSASHPSSPHYVNVVRAWAISLPLMNGAEAHDGV
ncbi:MULTISPECIES: hypothetical protein [Rhizobium/Agrobacterium group]|uniref:hypothetical protein n=1 Tax=Rhizobium/Agrobacterium group TaxID=227290 RepID=UPI0012E78EB0|nr:MULTISPECIES: hypothetical protein [Rhizobium/Agrobacterium group]MUO91254.1 hypothetical protein [Agrobacterium vitis]MUZ54327.1 hypothetical protein [Agrobacterium vitis]MUZ94465.1 hypothetical protein [Agrobacterium vitis]MVA41847.1 hypothetical protein [Agrobacterium vitis]MVA48924.1 hypothetical protein [Agrobacterium vitis]